MCPIRRSLGYSLVLSFIFACSTEERDDQAPFPVSTPEVRTAEIDRGYVATLAATRYVEVRSRVDGVIDAIPVDEGRAVHEGDLLFAVNTRLAEQQAAVARALVRGAEADLAAARAERDNTQLLVDREVVSAAELRLAEARVASAQAQLEEARANAGLATAQLDMALVRAPFAGVVNRIPLKVGSTVTAQELLTTLADSREVFAYFHLSEREALDWTAQGAGEERRVTLELADGTFYDQPGRVDAILGELDRETRTLAVRARFPNDAGRLRHGASAKVHVYTSIPNALFVPQRATMDVQGNTYVYVVDSENVARSRKVVPQLRMGDAFVIESGLSPSERIVVEGVHKLRDGQVIPTRLEGQANLTPNPSQEG